MQRFGEKLRLLRKRHGMTQMELAEAVGYTAYSYISEVETGKLKPKTIIETRGEGGYFLAPGCPAACHETGRLYEHLAGPPLTEVPTITPEASGNSTCQSSCRSVSPIARPASTTAGSTPRIPA